MLVHSVTLMNTSKQLNRALLRYHQHPRRWLNFGRPCLLALLFPPVEKWIQKSPSCVVVTVGMAVALPPVQLWAILPPVQMYVTLLPVQLWVILPPTHLWVVLPPVQLWVTLPPAHLWVTLLPVQLRVDLPPAQLWVALLLVQLWVALLPAQLWVALLPAQMWMTLFPVQLLKVLPLAQLLTINFWGILLLWGLNPHTLLVSADMATSHWSERSSTYTATTTTAGPLKLTDFCPGVEYLMSQNKTTTTFLRVNLSDCGSGRIRHLSRQGVVYGVCQDLTTFCTQRIVAPQGICIKTREDCAFVNGSDAHMLFDDTVVQHSDAMFTCDDDTTTTHYTSLCDFIQGCPDGTDESFCEHPSCSGFLCSNGQCVLSTQRCNQHSDCLDDSDEIWCPDDPSYLLWFTDEARQQWVYVNLDGTGYFTQQVMTSDQTCPDTHYPCQAESLYCLPVYTRCNGLSDCVYGEDEQNCETVMCRDFYRCQSSTLAKPSSTDKHPSTE
ncbi:hypothetical protein ACOMHN_036741 [Nucella lapillus]